MIKETELRIGNMIDWLPPIDGVDWEAIPVDHNDISLCATDNDSFNVNHRAITLSEDRLLKIGAINTISNDPSIKNYNLDIGIVDALGANIVVHITGYAIGRLPSDAKDKPGYIFWVGINGFYKEIRFMHGLQNLVFALTEKELEIK